MATSRKKFKLPVLSDTVRVLAGLSVFFIIGIAFVWVGAANAHAMTALLWALACYVLGALIGFLFGIPRVLQGNPVPPVTAGSSTTATAASTPAQALMDGYDLRINTNLEQISDWLTKIIVGLGLVELRTMPARLKSAAHYVAGGLDSSMDFFAGGLIVYFTILGFMGAYLITRLYITGAFSRADRDAMKIKQDEQRVKNINVPAIGNNNTSLQPGKALSEEDEKAAKNVASKPLTTLATPVERSIWAKAQLTLGNYKEAASAYGNVINQLSGDPSSRFAYATALYYTGAKEASFEQLLEAQKRLLPTSDKTLRMNIYRSITFQALYLSPPKSFDEAIRFGEEYVNDPNTPVDPAILVNLAAGYGQKMKWLTEHNSDDPTALQQTRTRALEIVKQAANQGEGWKRRLQELMDKDFSGKDPAEDDLEVFIDDADFRKAVGLPV
jgi:tetratricopeptide (TPR) repeat protein